MLLTLEKVSLQQIMTGYILVGTKICKMFKPISKK